MSLAGVLLPLLITTSPAPGKAATELAQPQSRFIEIAGGGQSNLQLHYLQTPAENGQTSQTNPQSAMVLLHGFTLNAFSWSRIMPLLAQKREVIAYDQIPYGLSEKPVPRQDNGANHFTLDAAVTHLMALLDAKGVKTSVLVSNSSGGALALAAAHRHPERVTGLVLINPMATVERMTLPRWLGNSPQVRRLSILAARWFGSNTTLLEASYHNPELITEQRRELALLHTQVEGWDLAWGEIFKRALVEPLDVERAIAEVEVPILVLIGAEDAIIPPKKSQQLASRLNNARSMVLANCGHLAHEECPEQTYEKIRSWLESL